MSKSTALIIGVITICLFGVISLFNNDYPAGQYLTAIVTLVTGYFAIQVVNNGVKGKYWNHDMYHHEHDVVTDKNGGSV